MKLSRLLMAGAAVAGPVIAKTAAPAVKGIFDNVVNKPGIGWGTYGANMTAKQVAAPSELPGGAAVRFTVSAAGAHPYDTAAFYASTKPIAKGDTVVTMLFLRAPNATDAAPLSIPIGISEAAAPYAQIANETVQVGPTFKRVFVAGVSPKDFAPGQARIVVQLAGAKQVVELGAAFLLDPGAGFDASKLPRN